MERRSELCYDGLAIDASRGPADPVDPRVAILLAEALRDRPLDEVPTRFLARLAFLRRHRPDLGLPDDLLGPLLAGACAGRTTLREVQDVDWPAALRQTFPTETLRLLDAWAPDAIQLPKGRPAKIHYEDDPPWIASRLQDFWGLKKSPTVAGGACPWCCISSPPTCAPCRSPPISPASGSGSTKSCVRGCPGARSQASLAGVGAIFISCCRPARS